MELALNDGGFPVVDLLQLPPPSELLALARASHQKAFESVLLSLLAAQSLATGNITAAAGLCAAALEIFEYDPTSYPAGFAVSAAAEIASRNGDYELAARVHGRLAGTQAQLYSAMSASFVSAHVAAIDEARTALGDAAFDAAVATGTGLPWESAITEISDYLRTLAHSTLIGPAVPGGHTPNPWLTERQLEVIRLLVAGLTNKEIARRLGLTPKTVMHHTVAIYKRLGVRGRSEAVAWALRADVTPAPANADRTSAVDITR